MSAPASTTRPGSSTCACAADRIGKDELVAAFEAHPVYSRQEKLRIDVLKRFGVYSTESNGHLSEYLPWYRKRPDEIARWIDMSELDPWRDRRLSPPLHRDPQLVRGGISKAARGRGKADRSAPTAPTSTPATYLEALETGRVYRGHFNVRNDGVITNLPPDAIIESPGFVDRFGLNMVAGITLPEACAATCMASINVQRMSVHAAISGDLDLLEAGGAARSAGRRHLHAGGGLADGRRDGGGPGRVAAAICACDRRLPATG